MAIWIRFGIRVGTKVKSASGESRVHLPVQPGGEGRPRRIGAVDDHQLAGPGLIALLDPDLPVHVRFAEREMIGRHAIDGRGSDLIGGLQRLDAVGMGAVAPAEEVFQRKPDPNLL